MSTISMGAKPSTFTYEGEQVSGTPNTSWPRAKLLAWLAHKDFPKASHALVNVARQHNTTVTALLEELERVPRQSIPNVTPNTVHGPLSPEQKAEIYTYHSEEKTSVVARWYGTNAQNVRLAKRQQYSSSTPGRRASQPIANLTPCTPNTSHGSLTQEQQDEIRIYHQDREVTALALTYNTTPYHIKKALHSSDGILRQAAVLIGVDVQVLISMMESNNAR